MDAHAGLIAMATGIYSIKHKESGKQYIGSTFDIRRRWNNHLSLLKRGKHHSPILQHAWDKYGESAFEFEILEQCEEDDLIAREQVYINNIHPSYNCVPVAGSRRGVPLSSEQIAKMSARLKGRPLSIETRNKISKALRGKPRPKTKGRPLSERHRINIGNAVRGKRRSPESRSRLSVSLMGHSVSKETREKIGMAQRGRVASLETRMKMSVSRKGKSHPSKSHPISDEAREKIRLSALQRWAKRKLMTG